MNKLFVYGIFLSDSNRIAYGMRNPCYDAVLDYATYGGCIVTAYKQEDTGLSLTGLVVDVDPDRWGDIDRLEGSYDREIITTVNGVQAYIYAGRDFYGERESSTASGENAQAQSVR